MKPQRYPSSIIKVGAVLYKAFGWVADEGKCHVDVDEWIGPYISIHFLSLNP